MLFSFPHCEVKAVCLKGAVRGTFAETPAPPRRSSESQGLGVLSSQAWPDQEIAYS